MLNKKSNSANLENKRTLFLQIGMIVALGIVLTAFEWKSYEKMNFIIGGISPEDVPEEQIIQTDHVKPKIPPKPRPANALEIVENTEELDEEIEIDASADQDTKIEPYQFDPPEENADETEDGPFVPYQEPPSFPGGEMERIKFLQKHLNYPAEAREIGLEGTVYIYFVVEIDGSLTNIKVMRSIGGGCDEEALRVVKKMPKWNPGTQRGRPVRVRYRLPIRFTLR
ncbi:MAG: energy transducer TonB [Bacteroidales bacterium]|nr:energy transducer TonB [Bacteroidales bacterium]